MKIIKNALAILAIILVPGILLPNSNIIQSPPRGYTWPVGCGTNGQTWTTDGNCQISWASPAGGTITGVTAGTGLSGGGSSGSVSLNLITPVSSANLPTDVAYTDQNQAYTGILTYFSSSTFNQPVEISTNSTSTTSGTALVLRSMSASGFILASFGRTSRDGYIGTVGAANNFFTGTAAGDFVMANTNTSGRLDIGVGTSGTPALVVNTSSVTINGTLVAVSTIAISGVLFNTLGAASNGTMQYCSDCTTTTPASCTAALLSSCVCAGSGTGAFAKRLNGSWYCN